MASYVANMGGIHDEIGLEEVIVAHFEQEFGMCAASLREKLSKSAKGWYIKDNRALLGKEKFVRILLRLWDEGFIEPLCEKFEDGNSAELGCWWRTVQ